jgi:hypothetical protein
MSTVRSIERRLFVRREADRKHLPSVAVAPASGMEWSGIWSGYTVAAGVTVLLVSLVLGIGFSMVNPLSPGSWQAAAGHVGLWAAIACLIGIFIGGLVTGQYPAATHRHAIMKSVAMWGLVMITTTLLAFWIAGMTAASVASAAGPIAGAVPSAAAAASRAANAAPTAAAAGSHASWGLFLFSILSLGCAIGGGAIGGGGERR